MHLAGVQKRWSGALVAAVLLWAVPFGSLRASSAAAELDEALVSARGHGRLLVLALVAGAEEAAWARAELARPEWARAIHPHAQVALRADERPSVAVRFGVSRFPLLLVLDGEGRELGRVEGRQPAEALARKVAALLGASKRLRQAAPPLGAEAPEAESLFWEGACLWNGGERALAAERFERVLGMQGSAGAPSTETTAHALELLAEHHLDNGRHADAERCLRKAIETAPAPRAGSRTQLLLAMSLRGQGRLREAAAELEEKARSSPGALLDEELFSLGYLLHQLGDEDAAARRFLECAERYPETVYGRKARRYVKPSPAGAALDAGGRGASPGPRGSTEWSEWSYLKAPSTDFLPANPASTSCQ
ncbi:MAG: tetratricopeptide repeat protein [Planctomycetes bacterium]|nr:tetratricopeptide repeat protein [Planctomycetota bacterium]